MLPLQGFLFESDMQHWALTNWPGFSVLNTMISSMLGSVFL